MRKALVTALVAAMTIAAAGCSSASATGSAGAPVVLRLGFQANITHEPALVGLAKGFFAKELGKNVTLKPTVFSSGTEETTALLAGQLDAAYVGPNPAINAWSKSNGTAIKIISGAASGGASLVVKHGITSPAQLKGKSLATPSLGNTQDVALRYWLKQHGLVTTPTGGGDVAIKPIKPNSAAVLEFKSGQIQANSYISANPSAAAQAANGELTTLLGKGLSSSVLTASLKYITFTNDPQAATLSTDAQHAVAVGLLKPVSLTGIYDLGPLNTLLKADGQPQVAS